MFHFSAQNLLAGKVFEEGRGRRGNTYVRARTMYDEKGVFRYVFLSFPPPPPPPLSHSSTVASSYPPTHPPTHLSIGPRRNESCGSLSVL